MTSIKLAIADDHRIFRTGLISTVVEFSNIELIIEAENGRELIRKIGDQKPDVILMDIKMPEMDGFEATAYIHAHYPSIKILALTMYEDKEFILRIIEAGARGYILKNAEPEEIELAINTLFHKDFYFNNHLSEVLLKNLIFSKLTEPEPQKLKIQLQEREIQILKLICKQYTNAEIGEEIHLSARTIDGYRIKLLEKTGARNTAGLVLFAIKNGIAKI